MKKHLTCIFILASLLISDWRFVQADDKKCLALTYVSTWPFAMSKSLTAGSLQFSSSTYPVGEAVGEALITVTRAGGSDGTVTVDYAASNGTAITPADYSPTSATLSFSNGETSKTFTIPLVDDYVDEPDETVNLALSNPTGGAVLGSLSTAILTINDNDPTMPFVQGTWANAYGGSGSDLPSAIQQTIDGGYIFAGRTNSFGAGGFDGLVVKLDPSGNVVWQKTYGGAGFDELASIHQTADLGFIVAGSTSSFGPPDRNAWVMKLDYMGNILWQKTYGGAGFDSIISLKQSADGNLIAAGRTSSFGAGLDDVWVIKLDSLGAIIWQRAYGGTSSDTCSEIEQTVDGGYIVAGSTQSFGPAGSWNFWTIKLDGLGNSMWQKVYGGNDTDVSSSIELASDGYLLAGFSSSFGAGNGFSDVWVIKLDLSGNIVWQKVYGGSANETASFIQRASDGDFIIGGRSDNFGAVQSDIWIMKIKPAGDVSWQKVYGGASVEDTSSIIESNDGGYIVIGTSLSFGPPLDNIVILKLDANANMAPSCPFRSDSTAIPLSTSAVAANTTANPSIPTAIPISSNAGISTPDLTNAILCAGSLAGSFQLTLTDYNVSEGIGSAVITVTRTGGTEGTVTVDYAASNGTATSPQDYIAASGTLTLAAGETRKNFFVQINDDSLPESSETINISLSNATGNAGLSSPRTGVVTINDNDPTNTFLQRTWTNAYGGGNNDVFSSLRQTSDGGFIAVGRTDSFGSSGGDIWVLRLDADGVVIWQRKYGGLSSESGTSIRETGDGGYIVAGTTNSFGQGNTDALVLRLDSVGNVIWQKTYGGAGSDAISSLQQTSDGGYILAGRTSPPGGGPNDVWILKLNPTGNISWQRTYGGPSEDSTSVIEQTNDGGYIFAGNTQSFGPSGGWNAWVLKLNASGVVIWQKTYSGPNGSDTDTISCIKQVDDGGYIVAGSTSSFGMGNGDAWVFKLDPVGNIAWQKTYGGANPDSASWVHPSSDGGYIVAGNTQSFGAVNIDIWVLKLDSAGNVFWQKVYGGLSIDSATVVEQTINGGYIIGGDTLSSGAGSNDFLMLMLDGSANQASPCLFVTNSNAAATNSSTVITNSQATVQSSSAVVNNPNSTVSGTAGTNTRICPCTFSVSPTSQSFPTSGGSGILRVTAPSGCNWSAHSNDGWVSITSGTIGAGSDTVTYEVRENFAERFRTATLTVAGITVFINQAGSASEDCVSSIVPTSQSFPFGGGMGTVSVNAFKDCVWTASSSNSWITITSGNGGIGPGSVTYIVDENASSLSRKGIISISGKVFTVKQKGN